MKKVLVFGSANIDFLIKTNKFPNQGETVKSEELQVSFGGKGANQAIAAAKAGSEVTFVGAVGADEYGQKIIENLQKASVNSSHVQVVKKQNSGIGIVLLYDKNNRIIINGGANDYLLYRPEFDKLILEHDTILLQNEVPVSFNNQVIARARALGKTIIFNPAPGENLKDLDFEKVDYVTPNEHEFELLKTLDIRDIEEKAVITLGEKGAKFKNRYYPTKKVEVVDTTGAGDTFNGFFASNISKTSSITEVVNRSLEAATRSVTHYGAQS